ncbi:unnamed protein product, partial [Ectocarpus sp. 12 AP-2014]
EYLRLFEKLTAATKKHGKSSSKRDLSPLTEQEERRLDELEEELPLQAIVMFRTMARKELKRKRDEEKAERGEHDKESDDKKGGGWWSNLWGGDGGDDTPVQ